MRVSFNATVYLLLLQHLLAPSQAFIPWGMLRDGKSGGANRLFFGSRLYSDNANGNGGGPNPPQFFSGFGHAYGGGNNNDSGSDAAAAGNTEARSSSSSSSSWESSRTNYQRYASPSSPASSPSSSVPGFSGFAHAYNPTPPATGAGYNPAFQPSTPVPVETPSPPVFSGFGHAYPSTTAATTTTTTTTYALPADITVPPAPAPAPAAVGYPQQQQQQQPVFSGFSHAIPPATTTTTVPAPAPIFSGFSHALPPVPAAPDVVTPSQSWQSAPVIVESAQQQQQQQQSQVYSGFGQTDTSYKNGVSEPATTMTTATNTPKPAPVFSGFAHALPPSSSTTSTTTTTTATTAPVFSGFDHAIPSVLVPEPSSAMTTTTNPPAPVFSGFDHAFPPTTPALSAAAAADSQTVIDHDTVNHENDDDDDIKDSPTTTSILSVSDAMKTYSSDEDGIPMQPQEGLLDPDLEEAKEFLYAARDKVLQLRQEIDEKQEQQERLVQELQEDLRLQEEGYQRQLKMLETDYSSYKDEADRIRNDLQEQLKENEQKLSVAASQKDIRFNEELSTLKQQLAAAHEEAAMAQRWTQSLAFEKTELEKDYAELKQQFIEEHIEWEDRLEMEQNARQRDIKTAEEVIKKVREEMKRQVKQARADGRSMSEAVRSDLSNRLWQKETMLQKSELALKRTKQENNDLKQTVDYYEWERDDLPSLTQQTAKIAKNKAVNTFRRAKNFFRRDKMG